MASSCQPTAVRGCFRRELRKAHIQIDPLLVLAPDANQAGVYARSCARPPLCLRHGQPSERPHHSLWPAAGRTARSSPRPGTRRAAPDRAFQQADRSVTEPPKYANGSKDLTSCPDRRVPAARRDRPLASVSHGRHVIVAPVDLVARLPAVPSRAIRPMLITAGWLPLVRKAGWRLVASRNSAAVTACPAASRAAARAWPFISRTAGLPVEQKLPSARGAAAPGPVGLPVGCRRPAGPRRRHDS